MLVFNLVYHLAHCSGGSEILSSLLFAVDILLDDHGAPLHFLMFLAILCPFSFPNLLMISCFSQVFFFNKHVSILKQSALPLLVSSTKLLQSCCNLNTHTHVCFLRCASLDEFHPPADRE